MASGIGASISPAVGMEGRVGEGGPDSLDQVVKGVPIQCIVRIKPNNGYQRDDVRVSQNRLGLVDTNNRVREEYNVSEIFTQEATNSTIFN